MSDRLAEIRAAIDSFQMDRARALAATELEEDPSAEAYYLAAMAALKQGQRLTYLEKALELDPAHAGARAELAGIRRPDDVPSEPEPKPAPKPKAEPEPISPSVQPATSQFKLASLGKRFIAICIDGFIVALFSFAVMAALGHFAQLYEAMSSLDEAIIAAAISQFQSEAIPVNLVVSGIYNVVLMVAFNGQTLGKMVFGMRVVKKNGGRITVLDAFVRNVFGYTISQIFLLGYMWAALDGERQAWHDKMAGTMVVEEVRTAMR
ncbi:MAG: RDD family protein [Chloroflexi bacterium]|nr:RDD family protein [Chloroflexota bacterium]